MSACARRNRATALEADDGEHPASWAASAGDQPLTSTRRAAVRGGSRERISWASAKNCAGVSCPPASRHRSCRATLISRTMAALQSLAAVEKPCGPSDYVRHVGKSLPVHHVKPFREFRTVEQANARSNLVGLCQSCHMRREHPPSPRRKAVHPAQPSVERSRRIPG